MYVSEGYLLRREDERREREREKLRKERKCGRRQPGSHAVHQSMQ